MDHQEFDSLARDFGAQWFRSGTSQQFDLAVAFLEQAFALGWGVASGESERQLPREQITDDEWTKVISGDRLVKFTTEALPGGTAFLTAQIAGHEVVYSVILGRLKTPLNRDEVERRFRDECPPNPESRV